VEESVVVATKQRWLYSSSCGGGLCAFASVSKTRAGAGAAVALSVRRGDFGHRHLRSVHDVDDRRLLGDDDDVVGSGGRGNRG